MVPLILVLDDDQSILDLYQLVLEEEGYRVHLVKIAFEKVQEIEAIHPDLIILDLKMNSHTDGFLLLQKLKMYRPTKDIPVIVCTAGLEMIQEQEEIYRQKGIPILYKPFDLDELLVFVRQALSAQSN